MTAATVIGSKIKHATPPIINTVSTVDKPTKISGRCRDEEV